MTGQIISRLIVPEEANADDAKTPRKHKSSEALASAESTPLGMTTTSAKKVPSVPTPKGEVQTPGTGKHDGNDSDEEQASNDEADGTPGMDLEAELQALEAISSKKRKKDKGDEKEDNADKKEDEGNKKGQEQRPKRSKKPSK